MTETQNEIEFAVRDVAYIFDKTPQWVRWADAHSIFTRDDGSLIIPRRTIPPHAVAGYRRYSRRDVVEMADSLLRDKRIEPEEHQDIIARIDELSDKINEAVNRINEYDR